MIYSPNFTIRKISYQEKLDWIILSRSQNIGPITFFNLLRIFGSAGEALKNIENYSLKGGLRRAINIAKRSDIENEMARCEKIGASIISFLDPEYPKLLREIADPPPILTARGNISLLNKNIVAIVGPRNSSINGYKFAYKIAEELGQNGLIIASGLARGIDSAAHLGSIKTGTIAVNAGGVDHIYPKENEGLYSRIVENGAVISEIALSAPPHGGNFPQRNRIIAGLGLGVVVVEATLKSGTLITARFALEENREIFAVPGHPLDPRSQGTNLLIKQGAKLIENSDDILEEINILLSHYGYLEPQFAQEKQNQFIDLANYETSFPSDSEVDGAREKILQKLGFSATTIDDIAAELEIEIKIINIALIQLELAGKVENKGGKVVLKWS